MEAEQGERARVSKQELQRWMTRRDAPAWTRVALQVPLFLGSAVATAWLAASGHPAWMGTVLLCGVFLVTFFPSLHETGHRTAFRSGPLNEGLVWLSAFLMLQAPSFFREFHWQHHRATQSLEHDPEIAGARGFLVGWPRNLGHYLARASGQALLVGKALFTLASAVLFTPAQWQKVFPFIRVNQRRRIQWESRLVIVLWCALLVGGFRFVPGFGHVLLAWPIAHVLLGLFVMPEHTALAHEGSQLQRTRTIHSNALVRFLMWNMPYHAEHHAYPAVAFHGLPELHRALGSDVEHVSPGYLAFHLLALRHALFGPPAAAGTPKLMGLGGDNASQRDLQDR
ncbi:fatty acid desaturase [Archangium violaceum]|uniref:fatty acid desaturase n=1 Tax=Archangium violaceum TaxID=83451 RepID=UPI0036DB2385